MTDRSFRITNSDLSAVSAPVAVSKRGLTARHGADRHRRRLLGAYYTPDRLASVLVRWALADGPGRVLDPSFGGCAFLTAAVQVLVEKRVRQPGRLVFGVDIDPTCIQHARASERLIEANCFVRDFLTISPGEIPGGPFRAVVGNPPYVRHHWLKNGTRSAAREAANNSGVALPARASSWAYFLVHALRFLAPEGRLAMLVPEAIFQTDYSAPLLEALGARFRRVSLIHIRDRLFDGTDEPVVVVAAAGYGNSGKVTVDSVSSAKNLETLLSDSRDKRRSLRFNVIKGRQILTTTVQLLDELTRHGAVGMFGDLATVRIGFVTGANSYFIRTYEDLTSLSIPCETWSPVVARTQWLSGLRFTEEDHKKILVAGGRAFLIRPRAAHKENEGIQRWMSEGIESGIHRRFKCATRASWFRVELQQVPDAFATCARFHSPLLVLNPAGYRCSNTLHAVSWQHNLAVAPEAVAVGFLTSLVSVWAELHGRRYGGGVLKLEPGALKKVPVPLIPEAASAFEEIDNLIRVGREDDARLLADELVLRVGMNLPESDVLRLQQARSLLMSQRRPARDGGGRG